MSDAAEEEAKQEILFKKIKPPPPPAHGGAWKVAYADFVTAMMAFFLLLWLLNATTEEKLKGISNFFLPVGAKTGTSGGEGVFGGISATDPGPVTEPFTARQIAPTSEVESGDQQVRNESKVPDLKEDLPNVAPIKPDNQQQQFKAAEAAIQQAVDSIPELRDLHEAIQLDVNEDGLRIQLIDQQDAAMFKPGGAELNERTKTLLLLIASVVERLPNKLTLSGHTDATPFRSPVGKTNWELSLERANAGRRVLVDNGIPNVRFEKISGLADRDPLVPENPLSPRNRRLIIQVLREEKDREDRPPTPPRIFGVDQ
ncbi:MAG: OmpA family protein [Alphaproteobacteria bacterium]|nr:OmpA family protein [Alphaproteobacteria bacterium]